MLFLIFVICLVSIAKAEVWFNVQPSSLYNIGDDLENVISVSETGKQIILELSCGGQSRSLFLKYLENETTIRILQPLTKAFLGEMKGDCKIIADYGGDRGESLNFKISDEALIRIETQTRDYEPGEKIDILGKIEKLNTLPLEGFFEINLEKINFTSSGIVEKGNFNTSIALPEVIAAGDYLISIKAYEKENGEITNIGETGLSINVKQTPQKVDIALNIQSIKPGNNLDFKISLYDQSGNTIEGSASFSIEDLKGNSLAKALTDTKKEESFYIEKNLFSGNYKIKAYSSGMYGERQFYVEENEEVEFKILNNILNVKNIGNVKYDKAIQVKIGSVVEIISTELEIGEEKEFVIAAPDGDYDIEVTDGSTSVSDKGISLTGNAINIKGAGMGFFSRNKMMAWIFLIFVMGMFVFVALRKVVRKKFVLSQPYGTGKTAGRGVIKLGKEGEYILERYSEVKEAEHSLVLKGQKQDAALICLKIKNELSKEAKENLNNTLEKIYKNKGTLYRSGEYNMAIFSPLLTRTFKNYTPAVKTALEITKALQEYNSRARNKIDFGISVHSGAIINRIEENKLKFTSLGNILTLSKKIAELSENEVLLSKEIHTKTISEIRAEKIEKQGFELFVIKRVTDTEKNEKFIHDFLGRQEEEKKARIK